MDIASITRKGLRDYFLDGNARGLKQDFIPRIRTILFALRAAPDMATLEGPPGWRIHQLKGDRAGEWSISVTGNWRLTFEIRDGAIAGMNLEDYH
jgi:proteic killer suppression protein